MAWTIVLKALAQVPASEPGLEGQQDFSLALDCWPFPDSGLSWLRDG
jgi:hypothetical protein